MLKELIDKFYLDKEQDRTQTHFYITDAGKCSRAVFFKFKKAPKKEMEARVLRMFDHGDYIHRLIMRALFGARKVRVVASEIDMPPQELISGRADAIISVDNELYVLDIKSMNSMIFDKLEAPKEDNANQLQLYLHFFQVPKGILLYVNKDNQDLKEFIVNYDRNLCLKLLKELQELKKKIDTDIIPLPLPDYPENWQCRYCQFKEVCDLIGRKEMSWLQFKKQIEEDTLEEKIE
jgi:CRISPR/Cas system-associated exonuclease Cas4 (RecB family)